MSEGTRIEAHRKAMRELRGKPLGEREAYEKKIAREERQAARLKSLESRQAAVEIMTNNNSNNS